MQSLSQNNGFVDCNRRIAFAATVIFLRLNGYRVKVTADDGEAFLIEQVIKRRISIESISKWLEKHMKKV